LNDRLKTSSTQASLVGGQITEYLARRVDDHRPKSIAACSFFRFSSASERKCGPHRALSITLLRYGITEQRHKPIAWRETAPEERAPAEGNDCPLAFVTYERRSTAAPPSDTGNQTAV
jgi:hypothetical protein